MSDHTKIEWADATVNAVNGCSVVSPGCTNCYAMRLAGTRMKHHPSRAGLTQDSKAGPVWTGEVRLSETALLQPLRWKRPRRIFWNAHGDLFHEAVPDEWIDRVFAVCALTPRHTHMILTKRSARMRAYFAERTEISPPLDGSSEYPRARGHVEQWANLMVLQQNLPEIPWRHRPPGHGLSLGFKADLPWPLPNVWLGVSVEDQARADERIPDLLATPAAIRFISAEPLLGPVEIAAAMHDSNCAMFDMAGWNYDSERPCTCSDPREVRIDWVIAGGESGPGARPMHPDWARSLRDQCPAAGVAFHFKQWGEWGPDVGPLDARDRNGIRRDPVMEGLGPCRVLVDGAWREFPSGYAVPIELCSGHGKFVYRLGKKRAGRLLDDVTHDACPGPGTGEFPR